MTRARQAAEAPMRRTAPPEAARPAVVRWVRSVALAALVLAASGCDTLRSNLLGASPGPTAGTPGFVTGFLGAAVADEPTAALVARDVLSAGGSAADAAVAAAFMLTVTLPSRAGLGGGGGCLAYQAGTGGPGGGAPEAILFAPPASTASPAGDRPAAVPLMARGLFLLHARYGKRPIEELIAPAERQARFGLPAPRALASDIAVVARPLAGDPVATSIFLPGGVPLAAGATLRQPDLAATLSDLRTAGIGDLYQGGLARHFVEASAIAGGPVTAADLRAALPRLAAPVIITAGRDAVAVLPDSGGLATAATLRALRAGQGAAAARGLAVAAAARAGGADPALLSARTVSAATLPALPASTTVATLDRDGNAVVCAFSMNNLFGTGRIAPGTGILLAASPAGFPPPLLAVALAYNTHLHAFRAAAAGSGQAAAPMAAALGLNQELEELRPDPPPDPGRDNVIGCARYLPGSRESCGWRTDPRGFGLAAGSSGGS
jgi:gamma-glutamyltranspeptidase/glutathione hydrolase